ncbi:MAG: tetratricopeptide repeat protein [Planctomycetota bacterium]|jgi:tetratricopeptide (TPR) repeat protein
MHTIITKYKTSLICIALAIVTILAFEQIRLNEFVNYDDGQFVTENPDVKQGLSLNSIKWAFTTIHANNWHPLTWLSHMLDCELFRLDPFGHHLTNLLFHIANSLLLFWVLNNMTGAVWASAFVAAAFALHPLHVESVAWVSERKDLLSSFFWILSMSFYVRYSRKPCKVNYLLTLLAFCLGLMSKPMVVTLPFVFLLLDYWPLERLQFTDQNKKKVNSLKQAVSSLRIASIRNLILEKIPFFSLSVAISVVTFVAQKKSGAMGYMESTSLYFRICNALVSYIGYIGKIFYPKDLAVLYPLAPITIWQAMASAVFILVICKWSITLNQKRKYLLVGWLWYIVTLVPVIGLIQVGNQAMADRYTYLPSIGIFIMVAWGVTEFASTWRYKKLILGLASGLIFSVMLICTRIQVGYWKDSITLCDRALRVTDNNFIMCNNFANALRKKGDLDKAIEYFNKALSINPDDTKALKNLGAILLKQGRFDPAIKCFNKLIEANIELYDVYNNLGICYSNKGKYDLAIQNFQKALQISPNNPIVIKNLQAALKEKDKKTK